MQALSALAGRRAFHVGLKQCSHRYCGENGIMSVGKLFVGFGKDLF
jgi:hypothetical protein